MKSRLHQSRKPAVRLGAVTLSVLFAALFLALILPHSVQTTRNSPLRMGDKVIADFGSPKAAYANAIPMDDQLFIWDGSKLHVSDIATWTALADISGSLGAWGGFDDGAHMVVDNAGRRIFVSDHDYAFDVYDFSLTSSSPAWGVFLLEPLGMASLPDGKLLVTDEEDYAGLFRLNSDLSLDAQTPDAVFVAGAEGVAYDSIHDRVFVADEDEEEIEIFNGATLGHIGTAGLNCSSDGPYWLGVDGSSNRLFALADSRCPSPANNYGIHAFAIISDGDGLSFDQTLFGSEGGSTDCYGALAVSESADRLFAIDYCNYTVAIYDTTSLALLGTVPVGRSGTDPLMVAVGHYAELGNGLVVTKSDWHDPLCPTWNERYEIVITNTLSAAITGVTVTDTYPLKTFFLNSGTTPGYTHDPATREVVWSIGTLNPSEQQTIYLELGTSGTLQEGTVIQNVVVVDSNETTPATASAETTMSRQASACNPSPTPTATATPTNTPTATVTPSATSRASATATDTPTPTATATTPIYRLYLPLLRK